MRIVALGQAKGGVGKSAAAINLACQAVAAGFSAGIVDMDADQGTALKWAARRNQPSPAVGQANAVTLGPLLVKLKAGGAQWVFLDLPGRNSPVASAGLMAAQMVLIPCRPNDVDLEASAVTVGAVRGAGRAFAYFMSIAPAQGTRAGLYANAIEAQGFKVAPVAITQRMEIPDALAAGKSAAEFEPKGKAAAEFRELFQWLNREVPK